MVALGGVVLQSLVRDVGKRLMTLRLFGCNSISDHDVHAIAQSCPRLRELELG